MPKISKSPVVSDAVAARLRAVQAELGYSTAQMASLLGVGRTRWANWIAGTHRPEVEAMLRLCDYTKITFDWLYRGRPEAVPTSLYVRLQARMTGLDVPYVPYESPKTKRMVQSLRARQRA
jgi:transcriptional regulator with XRE-family HTH domain